MSIEPHSVADVVEGLDYLAEKKSEVSIGDMLDEFGNRSFAPVMIILALMELTPLGGIPGFPTILAVCIALVAVQLLIAREHIWLPKFIERRSISAHKLAKATGKLDKVAARLDNIAQGRLRSLTHGPALQLAAMLILILCFTVPPLEFIPFASTAPMMAIAILSLAIMVRDGLAMLIAGMASIAALGFGTYFYYTTDTDQVANAVNTSVAGMMTMF